MLTLYKLTVMKTYLFLLLLLVPFNFLPAQNPPVAVNDTANTISEETVAIKVLLNDYDPDGDQIKIHRASDPQHGEKYYNDSIIYYTPDTYIGTDSLFYFIRKVNDPESISDTAWVFITVNENSNLPTAENDEFTAMHLVPTELDVLGNDGDPQNDTLVICDIEKLSVLGYYHISDDSLTVMFLTSQPLKCNPAFFRYRAKEKNTENHYYSDWAYVTVHIEDNPDLPTAVNDTANATGGVPQDIYVLENDINPDPGNFHLTIGSASARHGSTEINEGYVTYTPNYSYSGYDTVRYKVYILENPGLYDEAEVFVEIDKNPLLPVAVADTAYGVCGETVYIDLLQNDYDPENDEIEIKGFRDFNPSHLAFFSHVEDRFLVIRTMVPDTLFVNTNQIVLKYRIRKKANPQAYSNWANVNIFMEQNPDYPVLNDDQATTYAGYPVEIDVLANDELNGFQPEFYIGSSSHGLGDFYFSEDLKLVFKSYMTFSGDAKIFYMAVDTSLLHPNVYSFGCVDIQVEPNNSFDSLCINNINANIHSDGFLFSDNIEIYGEDAIVKKAHFKYPNGSEKNTILYNALWIGGINYEDNLHLAGQRNKGHGYDFQFGPVSNSYEGQNFFKKWNRVWKLNKEDIDYHKNNYWHEGYTPIPAISEWPGNGDVSNGQEEQIAPYYDKNNNGIYEPLLGDYPLIRGDQCILFIYNDDRPHTETNGNRMKIEIHGMAYEYDQPESDVLNNTVFVHYDLYNRSDNTFYNTYLGTFTETDLGYAWDDYIGSNVALSSYYTYNGLLYDGSTEPYAYGKNPPAQSVTILAGPYMDSDNLDNPDGECDFSVNGLNFGDGIVDNERIGMTGFIYPHNNGDGYAIPLTAPEYYNYLIGKWKNGTPVLYGGMGFETSSNQKPLGPTCKFMFPDSSDSCNWGTGGELPYGGYNQNGFYWTEKTADNGYPNRPDNRRGIGTTGPFTFKPGDHQELDLAFSLAVDKNNSQSSLDELFDNLDSLFKMVDDGEILIPDDELSVNEFQDSKKILKVYPNPAKDHIYVECEVDSHDKTDYTIYNSLGKAVQTGQLSGQDKQSINIQNLKTGFYFIKIEHQGTSYSGKFVKI